MQRHHPFLLLAILVLTVVGTVSADMVILKTGEIFQTQRAWRENGVVKYYENGRVVRIDANAVERLVRSPERVKADPPSVQRPAVDPPASTGTVPLPPLSTSDAAGHLDLRWGQPSSQFAGLQSVATDPAYGGVEQYSQNQPSIRFGRARVDDIIYGFWQGGLYTIIMWTSNFLDFEDMKGEAFRRFGEGIQNRDDVEKYFWTDKVTDRMLSYSYETDTGYLWMRSRALHEQVKARYPE